MIALTDVSHTLELVTSAAVPVDWSVTYFRTASLVAEGVSSDQGAITTASTTTIVPAPAASKEYKLAMLSAVNKDSALPLTVTLNKKVTATSYRIISAVLSPGDQIYYVDGANAPIVLTSSGRVKHDVPAGAGGGSVSSFLHTQSSAASVWTVAHNLNKQSVHVEVTTTGGVEILAEVAASSLDVLTVTLDAPLAGFARCTA